MISSAPPFTPPPPAESDLLDFHPFTNNLSFFLFSFSFSNSQPLLSFSTSYKKHKQIKPSYFKQQEDIIILINYMEYLTPSQHLGGGEVGRGQKQK